MSVMGLSLMGMTPVWVGRAADLSDICRNSPSIVLGLIRSLFGFAKDRRTR